MSIGDTREERRPGWTSRSEKKSSEYRQTALDSAGVMVDEDDVFWEDCVDETTREARVWYDSLISS
jgi:hypothetical protein